ncbi:MAG TPA: exodeoxyribonuclease VII small subunit [Planctomycetaceae bacterium]|nr:exodeoxyribonuclease VII small subunit [Planctomycetaceae bacterium]HAA50462.1 exodeoxyribonuclease VII small subunit [Planctomycetaceae bacterium]HCK53156.1 exodeoxyribonuclease VII small subunit [Planctomycetaceae bacterium]|tara:strand:+ start:55 stop:375 length:321 start_codon:yes stop_codon:yes gene_type:complete
MAKDKTTSENSSQVSFEAALEDLQGIVESLESGSLGLEDSLARFEEGIGLLKTCNDVLQRAEQRIETLTGVDADGNPTTEPFENEATIDRESEAGTEAESDEASLF